MCVRAIYYYVDFKKCNTDRIMSIHNVRMPQNIFPVFQKGEIENAANDRPIKLASMPDKIVGQITRRL